jgi:hypothetical protein
MRGLWFGNRDARFPVCVFANGMQVPFAATAIFHCVNLHREHRPYRAEKVPVGLC